MRVISQDGLTECMYDDCLLIVSQDFEIVVYKGAASEFCMGKYSTLEKCYAVLQKLRTAYTGTFITNADVVKEFDEQIHEMMKHGYGTILIKETDDCKVEFNNLNGYFQFPADDEVEV